MVQATLVHRTFKIPIKVYAIIEKGDISTVSPKTTIQGDTFTLSPEEIKDWDSLKQKIINDFTKNLWAKGDKKHPSGRDDWKKYVKIEGDVSERKFTWRGKSALGVISKGKRGFVTWKLL